MTDITTSTPASNNHGSSLMASSSAKEGITRDLSSIFRLGVLTGTRRSVIMRSMCIKKLLQICMSDEMLIPWLWQAVQSHCTVEAVGLQVVADRETTLSSALRCCIRRCGSVVTTLLLTFMADCCDDPDRFLWRSGQIES